MIAETIEQAWTSGLVLAVAVLAVGVVSVRMMMTL